MAEIRFPARERDFLCYTAFRQALVPTQPPIQWVPEALSPAVKRLGREAEHLPPASDEVNNGGAIPPFPHASSWLSVNSAQEQFYVFTGGCKEVVYDNFNDNCLLSTGKKRLRKML
jgi:hypothetical protein